MMASDNKIIRVGIVGCGDIFSSHAQAYPDHPHAIVVGFYDRIKNRAEAWLKNMKNYMDMVKESAEEAGDEEDRINQERCNLFDAEARVYDRLNELIDAVDLIDVCTPNYAHAPYAIWALKRGKSVMTEKPPARCSLETQWIKNVAAESSGFYQINENMFFQVFIRELKKVVDDGKIGTVTKISAMLGHGGPSWGWNNHFLNPSLSGGGAMSDMGIHAIGMAYGVIGPQYQVQKIQTLTMKSGTKPERTMSDSDGANEYLLHKFLVEDDAKVRAWLLDETSGNEIQMTIETSWARTMQAVTIEGTDGVCGLELDDKKRMIIVIYTNNGKDKEVINFPGQGRDSHQLEVVDFLTRVANGEKSYVDENWAHQMETIISGSYLSNLRAFERGKRKVWK